MMSWYRREEIERINRDWVDINCKISKREYELLEIIRDRKLVRRDMLEVISPSYRQLGGNRTRIINRSIRRMFKSMILDKVHEPQRFMEGNTPAILALDRAGSLLLNIPHRQRIKHVTNTVDGVKYIDRKLPIFYSHTNGVNQLEVETIMFCEVGSDRKVLEWVHEKPVMLFYGQERLSIIPDIQIKLKLGRKHLCAFIEYDTGTESQRHSRPQVILEKIIKYRKYKLSKIWEKDYEKFPIIILVSTDEHRLLFWNKECKRNGLLGLGIYHNKWRDFLESV